MLRKLYLKKCTRSSVVSVNFKVFLAQNTLIFLQIIKGARLQMAHKRKATNKLCLPPFHRLVIIYYQNRFLMNAYATIVRIVA